MRVGVIYAAVEPTPGVYDDAYLARIEATVDSLAKHGIVSLLDFHQDLYNERFEGEGWPDWAVQDDGLPAEPKSGLPGELPADAGAPALVRPLLGERPGPGRTWVCRTATRAPGATWRSASARTRRCSATTC